MWAVKILLVIGFIYVAVVAAIFFAQTSAIFPARMVPSAGPLPPGAERLVVTGAEGHKLHGIHIKPRRAGGQGAVILGFGGNAWNAESAAAYLSDLYPEADVVAFHYRGYRPSEGKPGAAALLADALPIHEFTAGRFPGRPIVAVGFSIGGGVAARLAGRREIAGAILVTPFDSLASVAGGHYPWLPVGLMFRHRMEPARDLKGSRVPVALIAGERDSLIPPAHAEALAAAVPNLVFNRTIRGAGHNEIYQFPEFRQAMGEALAAINAAAPRPI